MVSEKLKKLKDRYQNGKDNIGRDLVGVCLSECSLYRRGTGFFSGSALKAYAAGIDHVLKDGVKIEILCSPVIQDKKLISILRENSTPEKRQKTIQDVADQVALSAVGFGMDQARGDYRSILLSYLIASGQLELRFAIPKNYEWPEEPANDQNIYHVKNGYFKFEDDEFVAFDGSFNESDSGHQHHIDRTMVFRSWIQEDKARGLSVIADVDDDWESKNEFIEVFKLSEKALKLIKTGAPEKRPLPPRKEPPKPITNPSPPGTENLRWYQKEALESWQKNKFRGILEMATGTGKTKTAIAALKAFKGKYPGGLAVVTVPYQNLAEQWVNEIESTGLRTMRIYESFNNWSGRLTNLLQEAQLVVNELPVLVIVEKTFNSEKFQEILSLAKVSKEKNHLIIIDECHHFNREDILNLVPDFFAYRLGLSATPYDQFSKHHLDLYFEKIVFKFTLADAINNGFLTKYSYKFFPVYLNDEETIAYNELTQKIVSIAGGDEIFDPHIWPMVRPFLSQRSKIVAGCADKFKVLINHLQGVPPIPFSLFYCGTSNMDIDDGEGTLRQIEALTRVLHDLGWSTSRVTADEPLEMRERIINMLKGREIDAILSIKVLDEGIDIPACRNAYLLASQASDRQGIQRRGRVLRLSEGKDRAELYDFLVVGGSGNSKSMSSLAKKELRRAYNFSKDSINFDEIKPIIEDLVISAGFKLEDLYDKK